MLKNQPTASSSNLLLREIHFVKFKTNIIEALETYIEESNAQDKDGWQEIAAHFKKKLLQVTVSGSLVDLKNDLLLFCADLRSPFNKIVSTVVGPYWTKTIGSVLHAPGSTLQVTLLGIANQMHPFAAIYILNEIAVAKRKPIEITTSKESQYISFNVPLSDHEYLLPAGLKVLDIIVRNRDLMEAFVAEAKGYGEEKEARTLLTEFSEARRKTTKRC